MIVPTSQQHHLKAALESDDTNACVTATSTGPIIPDIIDDDDTMVPGEKIIDQETNNDGNNNDHTDVEVDHIPIIALVMNLTNDRILLVTEPFNVNQYSNFASTSCGEYLSTVVDHNSGKKGVDYSELDITLYNSITNCHTSSTPLEPVLGLNDACPQVYKSACDGMTAPFCEDGYVCSKKNSICTHPLPSLTLKLATLTVAISYDDFGLKKMNSDDVDMAMKSFQVEWQTQLSSSVECQLNPTYPLHYIAPTNTHPNDSKTINLRLYWYPADSDRCTDELIEDFFKKTIDKIKKNDDDNNDNNDNDKKQSLTNIDNFSFETLSEEQLSACIDDLGDKLHLTCQGSSEECPILCKNGDLCKKDSDCGSGRCGVRVITYSVLDGGDGPELPPVRVCFNNSFQLMYFAQVMYIISVVLISLW